MYFLYKVKTIAIFQATGPFFFMGKGDQQERERERKRERERYFFQHLCNSMHFCQKLNNYIVNIVLVF